jgi:hypothetical protein
MDRHHFAARLPQVFDLDAAINRPTVSPILDVLPCLETAQGRNFTT